MLARIAASALLAVMAVMGGLSPTASASVTGSMKDWLAAVCPGNPVFNTTTRFAIGGYTCVPRSGDGYVNFDQFDSESHMNTILDLSRSNYSAKTTLDGYPLAIWIPASRDGSELTPLKQFGFTVSPQRATAPAQPQTPSSVGSKSVPGLVQGAVLGQPCANYRTFVFGVGNDGSPLACASDGVSSSGTWVRAQPVAGTGVIGASCNPNLVAQSTDGRPLICGDRGWVPGP